MKYTSRLDPWDCHQNRWERTHTHISNRYVRVTRTGLAAVAKPSQTGAGVPRVHHRGVRMYRWYDGSRKLTHNAQVHNTFLHGSGDNTLEKCARRLFINGRLGVTRDGSTSRRAARPLMYLNYATDRLVNISPEFRHRSPLRPTSPPCNMTVKTGRTGRAGGHVSRFNNKHATETALIGRLPRQSSNRRQDSEAKQHRARSPVFLQGVLSAVSPGG